MLAPPRLVAVVVLACAVAVAVLVANRGPSAEDCDRAGRRVHEAALGVFAVLPDDGTRQQQDAALQELETAGAEFEEMSCEVDPFCDYEPPVYAEDRCAGP